jgi:hypothetical protein
MMPQTERDLNPTADAITAAERPLFSSPTASQTLFIGLIAEPDSAGVVNARRPHFSTSP